MRQRRVEGREGGNTVEREVESEDWRVADQKFSSEEKEEGKKGKGQPSFRSHSSSLSSPELLVSRLRVDKQEKRDLQA